MPLSPIGFVYVATGARHAGEVAASARSFRTTMGDVPIALFTDDSSAVGDLTPFAVIRTMTGARRSFIDKILVLKESPFERTVFLDTDTFSVAPCYELFELLKRFDCAAAHAPNRECWRHGEWSVPSSFPELNTGVIAYRNTPMFHAFVDDWYRTHLRFLAFRPGPPNGAEQPAFRAALYRSPLRFSVLPPEFNTRSCFPWFTGGRSHVRILHDRGDTLRAAISLVREDNRRHWPRVVDVDLSKRRMSRS